MLGCMALRISSQLGVLRAGDLLRRQQLRRFTLRGAVTAVLLTAEPVLAHSPLSGAGTERITGLLSAGMLAAFWVIYVIGTWRRPAPAYQQVLFHSAALLCTFALLGPLDHWAETSTTAHMTQHMLLLVVIAPCWVIARPLAQIIAGSGRFLVWGWKPMLKLTRHPMLMAYLQGAVIWFWHTPYFYMLAVEEPWWHLVEHACFLLSAGLFWWAILRNGRRHAPWAMLALLFTLMHTGFLGAVLTFARAPLYGEARNLLDQQLAGLIMWVPGAVPYLLAAVWIGYGWYLKMGADSDDAPPAWDKENG